MAWFVAVILILFYALGVYVFNAGRSITILPILALLLLVIDFLIARQLRPRN